MHRRDKCNNPREFCWILTLQCNKWAAVNTVMTSHITVMTQGTLLNILRTSRTKHPEMWQLPFPRHSPERRQLSRLCWTRQTTNAAPDTLTLGCSRRAVSWQRPRASLVRQNNSRFEIFRAAYSTWIPVFWYWTLCVEWMVPDVPKKPWCLHLQG